MSQLQKAASWAVIVIASFAILTAMKVGGEILAPIFLALTAGIILSPVTDGLERIGLPRAVSALASFGVGLCAIAGIVLIVQPVVTRTVDAFPTVWREVNSAIYTMRGELRSVTDMSEDVKALFAPPVDKEGNPADAVRRASPAVQDGGDGETIPTVEDVIFMAPTIAARILIFMGSLFFFVLTRREIYGAFARRFAPEHRIEDSALRFAHAERQVSRYFLTITLINIGLGVCVGAGMAAIGMPAPHIWGGLVFLLNYILYVGPAMMAAALVIAGVTVFDGAMAAAPAVIYLTMNMIEAQFVTPSLVGRSLSVNPLLVFLSLVLFMWLWGAIGAIVAIPLLVWGLVITSDIRSLRRAEKERLEQSRHAEPSPEIVR